LLERSQKGEFDLLKAHLELVPAYIGLGQEKEARAHAEEVLKINPNFSLSQYQKAWPYKNPAHLKRLIALYRKAGLPE
jgi:Tfp pilus assembly protein PilF